MRRTAKPKVGMLSLGCPRNLVDSESILGRLKDNGHPVVDITQADIGIVNTCSFVEGAKKESIEAILDLVDLKKEGRIKKIVVCGCLAQRYKDKLRRSLPEVDAFMGSLCLNHSLSRFAITPRHYAYLKICESCVNHCSYCVIPAIKGKFASLDESSVLAKVRAFNHQHLAELNVIGQDITGYGLDLHKKRILPQLLAMIVRESKHIGWIRLLYLYPGPIVEEIVGVMKDYDQICRYIDLPIQHINDRILKLMCRRTTKKEILKLIAQIRKTIPRIAIRTSLIVGFPSEQDVEFRELLDFVHDARLERLGVFMYSREEGTPAATFEDQIPERLKRERFNALMAVQQEVSRKNNQALVGKTLRVLIDEKEKDYYLGRTEYDAPEVDGGVFVHPNGKRFSPGDFVEVKITGSLEYDLVGEVVG